MPQSPKLYMRQRRDRRLFGAYVHFLPRPDWQTPGVVKYNQPAMPASSLGSAIAWLRRNRHILDTTVALLQHYPDAMHDDSMNSLWQFMQPYLRASCVHASRRTSSDSDIPSSFRASGNRQGVSAPLRKVPPIPRQSSSSQSRLRSSRSATFRCNGLGCNQRGSIRSKSSNTLHSKAYTAHTKVPTFYLDKAYSDHDLSNLITALPSLDRKYLQPPSPEDSFFEYRLDAGTVASDSAIQPTDTKSGEPPTSQRRTDILPPVRTPRSPKPRSNSERNATRDPAEDIVQNNPCTIDRVHNRNIMDAFVHDDNVFAANGDDGNDGNTPVKETTYLVYNKNNCGQDFEIVHWPPQIPDGPLSTREESESEFSFALDKSFLEIDVWTDTPTCID